MSIVEDFAGIRSRLEEIEKKPAAKDASTKSAAEQAAAAIANSWMYYVPEDDTAPSEIFCCYEGPLILTFGYPWLSKSAAYRSKEN